MKSRVECYAGASYPEDPRAVWWQGRRCPVEAVLNRQREPEGLRFWVICSPGARQFELYYDSITDAWDVQPWGAVPLNDNS
jgi:hypothetical protein